MRLLGGDGGDRSRIGRAAAVGELGVDGAELLMGELRLKLGDALLSGQLQDGAASEERLLAEDIARLVGLGLRGNGFGNRLAGFGAAAGIEERESNLRSNTEVVVLKTAEILAVVVDFGEQAVLQPEAHIGPVILAGVAEGLVELRFGVTVGGLNSRAVLRDLRFGFAAELRHGGDAAVDRVQAVGGQTGEMR